MMNLYCVACLVKGKSKDEPAITVYHGMALCISCLKYAHRTKKEKIW